MEQTPGRSTPEPAAKEIFEHVERSGALPSGRDAREAVAAVFCALSRRVSDTEAQDLASALPRSLRDDVEPCTAHPGTRAVLERNAFVTEVGRHLSISPHDAERLAQAVFTGLRRFLPANELEDVRRELPADLEGLWSPTA